jgi:hypothetical protein
MKNPLPALRHVRKFVVPGLVFLLLTALPFACLNDKLPHEDVQILRGTDLPQDVAVNPAFEMNPPLAKIVSIQKLKDKDNNLLVVADFGKGTIKSSYHAIQLPTGKVILRDDGRGVDDVAGDGKFSIAIHDDLDLLQQELDEMDKNRSRLEKELSSGFKGREIVAQDISFLKDFRAVDFKAGKRIPIPDISLCPLLLDVSAPHSLMVVDHDVLTSPDAAPALHGRWAFGTLITNIANTPVTGISPGDLLKSWLLRMQRDATANTDVAHARVGIYPLIKQAVVASGSPLGTFDETNWETKPLDPYKFPVVLTAIVNRLDLRGNMGYGTNNTGEGRFIFNVLHPETGAVLLPAGTIIFEYAIPLHTCTELKAFAQRWYDLKSQTIGSPAYNTALKAITDVFSAANADPTRTNGSALKQIRTNEIVFTPFSDDHWEMREFKLDPATHILVLSTTAQEPIETFNETSALHTPQDVNNLVAWINAHQTEVLADKHSVPLTVEDQVSHLPVPFLGAKARSQDGKWTAPGVAPETRHHFSLNTCTGCHRQETNTDFLHVGAGSALSGFLTGIDVPDPVNPAVTHHFNDLQFRKEKMTELLCTDCSRTFRALLTIAPNAMAH